MTIAKSLGAILVLAVAGGGAWFLAPNATRPAPALPMAETPAVVSGTPMADIRIPATFSTEAASGMTYYNAVCASCHGPNAAGQNGIAPPLVHQIYKPSHHADVVFLLAARNGVRSHHWTFGSMLPVEEKLTDAEIGAIVRYVRELQRENGIM